MLLITFHKVVPCRGYRHDHDIFLPRPPEVGTQCVCDVQRTLGLPEVHRQLIWSYCDVWYINWNMYCKYLVKLCALCARACWARCNDDTVSLCSGSDDSLH